MIDGYYENAMNRGGFFEMGGMSADEKKTVLMKMLNNRGAE